MSRIKNALQEDFNSLLKSERIEQFIHQTIFNAVKDLVFLMKVEEGPLFRYVEVNDKAREVAGLPETAIGKYIDEVLSKEAAGQLQQAYEHVVNKREPYSYQDLLKMENGRIFYGESILTPILDADHECRYVVSVTRDVTQSVLEKQQLNINKQRYQSLFDHNMDAVFSLDQDGNITSANPAAVTLTGLSAGTLFNIPFSSLLFERCKTPFEYSLSITMKEARNQETNSEMRNLDGAVKQIQLKTAPIFVDERVTGVYVIAKDVTDQNRNKRMIEYMAYHDSLTGLPNRSSLSLQMEASFAKADRTNGQAAVMYLDIDRFKYLNDALGHSYGDKLLVEVSKRIQALSDEGISVFRQGGDEFIILLEQTDRNRASSLAEEIITSFYDPFIIKGQHFYISVSIGISMFPQDGRDEETIIKNADNALYRVKENGKGHYRFYNNTMEKNNSRTFMMETELRQGLEKGDFHLEYQPQLDVRTGTIIGVEALLRWESGKYGKVPPGEFIPLAEETGLIIPIGMWVFEEVCRQYSEWLSEGYKPVRIAVNLSAKQFQQADLVNIIAASLQKYNLPPSCLEIEITEGAMRNTAETISILQQLKELGVGIAIDDFGKGYSSLGHLKRFPIDVLKIDQSFIHDILQEQKDAAITETIIHMSKSLGLSVIAEGVEQEGQKDMLLQLGCTRVQGYLYSKPVLPGNLAASFLMKKEAVGEGE
ncbi:sensor domain-containing protein [Bacillus marinisedimentorum]|uniref:sensor domain-containing protein n=1 Tax=Bacillus marinisedimentorum TaxID=1821260 RepID=UPI0009F5C2BC|nr:bifunctional diguanylate cyclase/phosphodiesterase [Bacillus marinisedimentorum]